MPSLSARRASARLSRAPSTRFFEDLSKAPARGTSGYAPSANSFSLPSNRYLSRHSLEPLGCTSRYSPCPSKSLIGFAEALALRQATSVSGMGVVQSILRGTMSKYTPVHAWMTKACDERHRTSLTSLHPEIGLYSDESGRCGI